MKYRESYTTHRVADKLARNRGWAAPALLSLVVFTGGCTTLFSQNPSPRAAWESDSKFTIETLGQKAPVADWWREFNNPELDGLINAALQNNQVLIGTEARLRASQAALDAASASLFPSLSLSASRNERTVKGGTLSPVNASAQGYTTSAQFSAEYEIDLWSRVRASRMAQKYNLQANQFDLQTVQQSVAGQTATAWVQWIAAKQVLDLLASELQDQQTNLKLVEFRFRQGRVPASDVLQQRQLVESTRGALATAKSDLKVIENSLTTLTAQPLGSLKLNSTALPALPEAPATGLPVQVLTRRPDVQQAWSQVAAADMNVAAAIASRFPQLSLQATFGDQVRDSSALFDNWVRNLSVNMLAPLFDGGARAAESERQRALLDQALAQYRQTSLEALQEVDNALVREQAQQQASASLNRQLELAEMSLKRLVAGYRNGTVNYLAVLNAQQSVSSLRRSAIAGQQQLLNFRIALYRAISGGLQITDKS